MAPDDAGTLAFGAYTLDTRTRRLWREGIPVPLTTKAFDTLEVLVRAAGQTVSKEQLLSAVWPDTFVQEDTLAQNVSTIRRALGDSADAPRYVLTVPREGYRFVALVERACGDRAATAPDSTAADTPNQVADLETARGSLRFAPGTRLAPFTLGVASGLLLAALIGFSLRAPRPAAAPPIATTFEVFEPEGTRFSASGGLLSLSPDGRYLAFLAVDPERRDQLWIRALGARASILLAGTQDAQQPFWSADGRSIAFFSNGSLRRIELSGEGARTICDVPATPLAVSGSWSSQNVILFAMIGRGLFQVSASGGVTTVSARSPAPGVRSTPRLRAIQPRASRSPTCPASARPMASPRTSPRS